MATFNINLPYSFVNGTAANDTFNISVLLVTAFGLDGDDLFSVGASRFGLSLDGGTGNDSFNLGSSFSDSLVVGGDGNDSVFMTSGTRNNFSGGAGNDWLGIGGGALSTQNTLDGGDGDDVVGATANSNWLFGGIGSDHFQVTGNSNTLDGGTGNDSLFVAGGIDNILMAGDGNDWLGTNGNNHSLYGGAGDDWMGATGSRLRSLRRKRERHPPGCRQHSTFYSGATATTGSGSAAVPIVSGARLAMTMWPPPATPTLSMAAPATTRWWRRQDISFNLYIFRPGSGQDSITGFEGERRSTMSSICAGSGWRTSPPLIRT